MSTMLDRTGQVWLYDRSVYLIVDAPFRAPRVREVMGMDVWYHPCVMIDELTRTVLGETYEHLWEDTCAGSSVNGDGTIVVHVRRERIA